jgi:hypothetical protein
MMTTQQTQNKTYILGKATHETSSRHSEDGEQKSQHPQEQRWFTVHQTPAPS